MPHSSDLTLLDPILVVELGSRAGVGALGGLMAQLGAETVIVEPSGTSSAGKWRNRPIAVAGKRSIVIDGASSETSSDLRRLLAAADVVLLSSDVDVAQQSIWDGERPAGQIVCDLTAYGHSGPLAGAAAPDAIVQALSGVLDTTGPLDGPPAAIGTPLLEMHTAVLAATAVVAALRVRRLHGVGQRIDASLFDVGVSGLINFLPLHLAGKYAGRAGNRHPLFSPWGAYKAQDGWILICAPMDDHWKRVSEAMGRPELADDPRFATTSGRLDNFRTIDELVNAWTSGLTAAEVEARLMKLGVACGPIVDIADLDRQPNMEYRAGIARVLDGESGRHVKVASSPLRGTPVGGRTAGAIPSPDADRSAILGSLTERREPLVSGDQPCDAQPYEGIRIVEVGQYTVAPLATRILGSMGASVIKVESPIGDAVRKAAPLRDDGSSYIFALSNTDKRGIVLDLRLERDQAILDDLLRGADALIENLKPGSLAKLGFGSAGIRQRHPHLIYCSVNGFGTDSLYPGRPALDTVVQAMSGLMNLTQVDGVPMKAGISASDNLGGQFSLLALAAALELRDRTGVAAHFDLAMQETSAWATQSEWNGAPREAAPVLLQGTDGYVAVAADDGEVGSYLAEARLIPQEQERAALVEALSLRFPCGSVNTVGEAVGHAQTDGRDLLVTRPTKDGDEWLVFSTPFKLMSTPPQIRTVLGGLGADRAEIMRELAERRQTVDA